MRIKNVASRYNHYKIMLLDDDVKFVKKKVEVLQRYGYIVEGETVVAKALSKLQTEHYDLLILDYLMDEMRGDKVVEAIRKFDKDLYILLLTGYAEAPALEIMDSLDITAYCEKSNDNSQLLVLIKSALKSVDMMKKVKKSRDGLNKILEAVPEIYKIQPINQTIKDILSELVSIVNTSDAFILLDNVKHYDRDIIDGTFFSGIGKYEQGIHTINDEFLEHIGYVRLRKKIDIQENNIFIPIISDKYNTLGVLYVKSNDKIIDEDYLQRLTVFATIAASSITNGLLQNTIKIKNKELEETKTKMDKWYLSTVKTIRLTIDARDDYTGGHSDRVASYAVKIAKAFNLSDKEIDLVRDSGIFHDVGKIGISDTILKKSGPLTKEEYEEIKKHPQRGAMILSAVTMFKDIVPIVLHHHERYDGKGYPSGLTGTEIPFLARILGVADAVDAMTTDRIYRKKKGLNETIEELIKGSGTQFDPDIVNTTIKLIQNNIICINNE